MTIVKELNELAEKMTGVNPRATTDAQAMDFIEQHYQGGQPSPTPTPQSKFDYVLPTIEEDEILWQNKIAITDTETINMLEEILTKVNNNENLLVCVKLYDTDSDDLYSLIANIQLGYGYDKPLKLYFSVSNVDCAIYYGKFDDNYCWQLNIYRNN